MRKTSANRNIDKRGSALYFAIVIMTIILAIAAGVSTILISQIRMVRGMEQSVIAFYAADTGIEIVLERIRRGEDVNYEISGSLDDIGASYIVRIPKKGENYGVEQDEDCDAANFCIEAVGRYQNTQRAIEIDF